MNSTPKLRPHHTLAPAAMALLLVACGGTASGPPTVDFSEPATLEPAAGAGTPTPGAAPTSEGEPTFQEQTFAVDQALWHSGFRVQLGQGRVYAEQNELTGESDYFVSIAASFENLGDRQTSFRAPVALVADGSSVAASRTSDLPDVPAGLATNGALVFEVGPDFDPATAQLIVGATDEIKARIPLGPEGGELDTLAPSEPGVSGELSLDWIDLRLTRAELRADLLENYSQVEDGKLALTLYFDVTSRRGGNWSIQPQHLALILPSGSAVAPEASHLPSLPGSEAGLDTTGLWARFLIDDPPDGRYTLRLTPGSWFIPEGGATEATIEFSLEDRVRGSSRE